MMAPSPKEVLTDLRLQALTIFLLASIIRGLPLLKFSAWGIDFGIYSGLTNSFLKSGKLFPPYHGWGASYQYFPTLYVFTAALHFVTGLPISRVLAYSAPAVGGLTVLILFLITRAVLPKQDHFVAYLTGVLLAVNTIHVFQTSKPYNLLFGHLFLLLTFYLWSLSPKKRWAYYLAYASALLLILSHHLSTYIFLISFAGAVSFKALFSKWNAERVKKDVALLSFSLTATLLYWYVAVPPLKRWTESFFHLPLLYLLLLSPLFYPTLLHLLSWLHPHVHRRVKKKHRVEPTISYPLFVASTVLMGVALVIIGAYGMGPINLSRNPKYLLLSIPTVVIMGLGVAGVKHMKRHPTLLGWTCAILLSLLLTGLTWSRTLFPERHMEYLVEVLSISSAMGVWSVIKVYYQKEVQRPRTPPFGKRCPRRGLPVIITLLIVSSGFISSPDIIGDDEFSEGISVADFLAVQYMAGNLSKNYTVATDHRLGTLLNTTYGFPCTFERAREIWVSDNLSKYLYELEGNNSQYPPIGYVLIDDVMVNDSLVLVDNGPHGAVVVIDMWEHEKFSGEPFVLLERFESPDGHWAEVYAVNLTATYPIRDRECQL